MKELVFIRKEDVFTTSLVIAEGTENEHESVIRLIQKNIERFERWGKIYFTDLKSGNKNGDLRGRPTKVAELNEQQATFLITLLRNNDIVLDFKAELVDRFYKMRELLRERETDIWQDIRGKTRESTRILTDAIQEALIPLALSQGMDAKKVDKIYMSYMKMINACLGIVPNGRDILTSSQLYEVDKVMIMSANNIRRFAAEEMEYHQIYREVKAINLEYASNWLIE